MCKKLNEIAIVGRNLVLLSALISTFINYVADFKIYFNVFKEMTIVGRNVRKIVRISAIFLFHRGISTSKKDLEKREVIYYYLVIHLPHGTAKELPR